MSTFCSLRPVRNRGVDTCLLGAKLHLKKDVDSVAPSHAIRCWQRCGRSQQVVSALIDFYQTPECEGVVHPAPEWGCSASPALMAGLMTVCMQAVKCDGTKRSVNQRENTEKTKSQERSMQHLQDFVKKRDATDMVLEWQLHPDQKEWAASMSRGKKKLTA